MSSSDPAGRGRREPPGRGAVPPSWLPRAGAALYLSLLGLLLAWTFGILFLTRGGVFAPLSDLASLLYNLPLLLVAWVLYRVYRRASPTTSAVVLALGLLGVATSVVAGLALTLADTGVAVGAAGPALTAQRVGGLLTGGWLLGVSLQERRQGAFGHRIAVAGMLGGAGLLLLDASLLVGGEGHPGFAFGSVLQLVGTVLWSIWLGRRLRAG